MVLKSIALNASENSAVTNLIQSLPDDSLQEVIEKSQRAISETVGYVRQIAQGIIDGIEKTRELASKAAGKIKLIEFYIVVHAHDTRYCILCNAPTGNLLTVKIRESIS